MTLWPGKFPRTSCFYESCSEILKYILTHDLSHILSFLSCVSTWGVALGGVGDCFGLGRAGFGAGRGQFGFGVWACGVWVVCLG